MALGVPPDGQVPLALIRTVDGPSTVAIALSTFSGEQGSAVVVDLVLPQESDRPKQPVQFNVAVPQTILPLRLSVPSLPTTGKYTGLLSVKWAGHAPLAWKITLVRGPAVLVLDQQAKNLIINQPFAGSCAKYGARSARVLRLSRLCGDDPTFAVTLREKSKQLRLEGITARLDQVTKAPEGGFDLQNNLLLWFEGRRLAHPASWPASPGDVQDRSIPGGGQATVTVTLRNLKPGEYSAVLRFQAQNSADDDAQKLNLTLQIRDSSLWALLILVMAITVSFLATKVLTLQKQRLALLRRLRQLRPAWLSQEPPVLPVVRARAILRQAEQLTRHFWLTGPDLIDSRVSEVSGLMSVLDQVRQTRQAFDLSPMDAFIKVRARVALDRVVTSLDSATLDDQATAQARGKVAALNDWLRPEKRSSCYWADLSVAISLLLGGVTSTAFPQSARPTIDGLVADLQPPPALPANETAMVELEKKYAALKILWERRSAPEFGALLDLWQQSRDVRALFQLADQQAWERLRTSGRPTVRMPAAGGPDAPEAYDPLEFRVEVGDPALEQTFLFQHGLRYEWALKLTRSTRSARTFWRKPEERVLLLTPVSTEPRIVQYAPFAGSLTVTVRIIWPGATTETAPPIVVDGQSFSLRIDRSKDFALFQAFELVEFISFAFAGLFAIASGLATFYFKGTAWGSLQDYLSLFVWGAAVDQTKNFVQTLQTYSTWPTRGS